MSVSKFSNSGDSDTATASSVGTSIGLTISQIANLLFRRDGGNKVSGDVDTSGGKLLNVADPVGAGDAATKRYADSKVNKAGDEVTANLIMKLLGILLISSACNDLWVGKRFNLLLGNTQNILYSQLNLSVILQTSNGFNCRIGDSDTVKFNDSNIMFYRDIYMNDCHISNLKPQASASDAATNGYVDTRIPPSTTQFQSLLADASGNYYATSTPDISHISTSLTTRQFDDLLSGLYAAFPSYIQLQRLGNLPINTKGYLVRIAYQINQSGTYDKLCQWIRVDNETY
jgi:hypothetical protein